MKKYILLIISFYLIISCGSRTLPTNNLVVNKDLNKERFYNEIFQEPSFENLKINCKINAKLKRTIPDIDAIIYIEDKQKIWINASVFFVNIARAVITPKEIKAYDKYHKQYIESDFSYINKVFNVNFIDYHSLQKLLLGRTFFPINETDFELISNSQGFILNSKKNQKILVDGNTKEYNVEMVYSSDFNLVKGSFQDMGTQNTLEIFYSDWTVIDSQKLPKTVKIIIKGKKNEEVLIENTKFEFSKIQTPYSVPSSYEKVEIK